MCALFPLLCSSIFRIFKMDSKMETMLHFIVLVSLLISKILQNIIPFYGSSCMEITEIIGVKSLCCCWSQLLVCFSSFHCDDI